MGGGLGLVGNHCRKLSGSRTPQQSTDRPVAANCSELFVVGKRGWIIYVPWGRAAKHVTTISGRHALPFCKLTV